MFHTPDRPGDEVVEAHQTLLSRFPRLYSAVMMRRRTEHAYLLVFDSQQDIETYLESPEFCRFRGSDGCYDAFVKVFDLLGTVENSYFDLPATAAVQQFDAPAILPA
jgi:hypothetical protein